MSSDFIKKAENLIKNSDGFARTGCIPLDLILGGGEGLGIPYGTGLNLIGISQSGKSLIGNEVIAAEYHRKKGNLKWQYEDAERGNRFPTESLYGIDIMGSNELDGVSDTVEDLDARHSLFIDSLKPSEYGIYLLDSLDSLRDNDRKDREKARKDAYKKGKEFKEGTYGLASTKFLSQEFFRNQIKKLPDKKSILIFVSQVRENMDPRSWEKYTTSGGKAVLHWMTTTVTFSTVKKLKQGDREIGIVVEAKLKKSRHARPYRSCRYTFYFDYGIDNIGSTLDYLYDLRGKDGELTKAAKEIGGIEKKLSTYKNWLEQNELYERACTEKKEETGKKNLSIDWIESWIEGDAKLKASALSYFGEVVTRDEIIQACEEVDEKGKLTKAAKEKWHEIEVQAIAKWEEEEDAIRTKRRGKYL